MTDKALKNAKALKKQLLDDRDLLDQRREEILKRLATVESFIHNWHAFAAGEVESVALLTEKLADSEFKKGTKTEQKKTTGNPSKEEVADVTRELIRKRGAPIPRRELLELLLNEGLQIRGTDREKVLSTMLWRMKREVVSLPRVGYWLAEEPYPPANYDGGEYTEQMRRNQERMLNED